MYNFIDIEKSAEKNDIKKNLVSLSECSNFNYLLKVIELSIENKIQLIKQQDSYDKHTDFLISSIAGIFELLEDLHFNYELSLSSKLKNMLAIYYRLDSLDQRKIIFNKLKNETPN